jgi:hypothetical protein
VDLVKIEPMNEGYKKFRMRRTGDEFFAKKSEGGRWYHIIFSDGSRLRHLVAIVEKLAVEVTDEPVVEAN